MDINKTLHNLQLEVSHFSDVVSQINNPQDTDFRVACDLFSQHVKHKLKSINSNICFDTFSNELPQITEQLFQINKLISSNMKQYNNVPEAV